MLATIFAWSRRLLLVFFGTVFSVWWLAYPVSPDSFYDMPLPVSSKAGDLLRSEPVSRAVPAGGVAWRILYVTTRFDGSPAVASAVVVRSAAAGEQPQPLIAWAHGTTGVARGCAPSVMADPFANVPAFPAMLSEGWTYVAADYVGLGTVGRHAYLIGTDAARSVLDAARAARQLKAVSLDDRVLVWGHSQGGHSALWTGMVASSYAPDLKLLGVAALAPASDLNGLVVATRNTLAGRIVSSYLLNAYAQHYPDVRVSDYAGSWRSVLAVDIASRCMGDWTTLLSVATAWFLPEGGVFSADPDRGALAVRLKENTPKAPIPVPLFIAQGETDDLVSPVLQRNFVKELCASGQSLQYKSYAGRGHVDLVGPASPLNIDLIVWTRDRLAGIVPAQQQCP